MTIDSLESDLGSERIQPHWETSAPWLLTEHVFKEQKGPE